MPASFRLRAVRGMIAFSRGVINGRTGFFLHSIDVRRIDAHKLTPLGRNGMPTWEKP
jgi:hypothetical protein